VATDEGGKTVASVVLADDHPLFLQALTAAVEGAGIDVLGAAPSGDILLDLMKTVEPDAVLLDLQMPGYDGFECIEELRRLYPTLRLIVVSATDDEMQVRRALDAGAVCFIGKSIDPNDLAAAVRALLSGAIHMSQPNASSNGAKQEPASSSHAENLLTRREIEILRLTAEGLSNGQMAKSLWVTEQTVKFHLSNIYRKIDVRNRTEASRWAQQNGVLENSA
jgi:DNA-binding NarL/FixJ family response regulator